MKHALGRRVFQWFVNLIRHSRYRWLVIFGSLIYLISPIDVIPDVLPLVGWIDDGALATIVITELTQLVLAERRKRTASQQSTVADPQNESVVDVEASVVG